MDAVSEEQQDEASSAGTAAEGQDPERAGVCGRGYPLREVGTGGPLIERGSGRGVAVDAADETELTDARGLQEAISSNNFCTARLRATVPVWGGGGGGGWFSLGKGVPARGTRGRGDGDGERDRVEQVEEAVERRGVAGIGVER